MGGYENNWRQGPHPLLMEVAMEEDWQEYQEKKAWPVLWKDENDIIYPVHWLRFSEGVLVECKTI